MFLSDLLAKQLQLLAGLDEKSDESAAAESSPSEAAA
jgi:hypothetical protein